MSICRYRENSFDEIRRWVSVCTCRKKGPRTGRGAGLPKDIALQPNWRRALELIDKGLSWGRQKPPVVLADSASGAGTAFREGLEQRDLA
jgi:hypothetical protein